jgi:hypothetical protein
MALQVDRLNQNVPVDSSSWDMSEQLIALGARKNAMTSYTDDLFLGAQEAHQALWPRQRTPTDPLGPGNDLQLSKLHLRELQDSGRWVGADEALTYFLSWYEKVDLETLRSVREGSVWTTDPEFIWHRKELAHSYVDYADTEVFIRDIREPKKKDDAEDAKGSDSSQDEKETEDAGNAGAEAPDQGSAPAVGDGSIPSAGSGTPEADISLPQLHLPAAPPLPLRLCKKHFKFYQIPGMPGAVVRYTLFSLVCYLNKFYFSLLAY